MATVKDKIEEIKNLLAHPEQLGSKCDVMSRVSGYYRRVEDFNIGKSAEFEDRKTFDSGIIAAVA